MKYFSTAIVGCTIGFILLLCADSAAAQYKNPYPYNPGPKFDEKKYHEDRRAEEKEKKEAEDRKIRNSTPYEPTKKYIPTVTKEIVTKKVRALTEYSYYDDIDENGLRLVGLENNYGYVNKYLEVVIPLVYQFCRYYYEGFYGCMKDGLWGFVDKNNKTLIDWQFYEIISEFYSGSAEVVKDGRTFYIDEKGNEIVIRINGNSYEEKEDFLEGLARVRADYKYGFIDEKGNQIVPLVYHDARGFKEGMASVELLGKWGFINTKGKLIIPLKYSDCDEFSNGLAVVQLNEKWGYIDKTGKVIIPIKYDGADNFSEGLAPVMLKEKWGAIDKTGRVVIPMKYDILQVFSNGVSVIRLGKKWGYIDSKGKVIIPPIYDNVFEFVDGKVEVVLNGISLYFDKTGKEVSSIPVVVSQSSDATGVEKNGAFFEFRGKEFSGFVSYKYVTINTQVWMAENLDAAYFINGDPIPEAKTSEEWVKACKERRPVWSFYDNDDRNEKYGKLYNWYAVNNPGKLAPIGWHLPTLSEFSVVANYLGGGNIDLADKKMRADSGWISNFLANGNGTNESGFSGLPGGYRKSDGTFSSIGYIGCMWTSTYTTTNNNSVLYVCSLKYSTTMNLPNFENYDGYSVRCIKD